MDTETIRKHCMSFPHATEGIQWGNDLVFRIGNKMFAVMALDPGAGAKLSFKCTPEEFAELIEREGIIPAPYMARIKWVSLERFNAIRWAELQRLLRDSYEMVKAGLPKKVQAELSQGRSPESGVGSRRKTSKPRVARSSRPKAKGRRPKTRER